MACNRICALVLLLAAIVSQISAAGVVCRDDQGNPVDWWYAIKLPRNSSQTDPHIVYGDGYMYILSSESVNTWTWSPLGADNASSMMGKTLAPVYAQPRDPNLMYILYNDENPDGNTTFDLGHTKGDLLADQDSGFWLIHSVPKYPSWDDLPYGYPSSGHMYGQNFLCISIDLSQVDKIGMQFQYSLPWIFNYNIPTWAKTTFPNLYDVVVGGKQATAAPWTHEVDLQSSGGAVFKAFAKHTKFYQGNSLFIVQRFFVNYEYWAR
ncbi:deoxyribonuclease II [Chamberlinius hualienensis]